jgi:hypothetical protein
MRQKMRMGMKRRMTMGGVGDGDGCMYKNTVFSVILFIPAHSLMSEDILNGTEQVCVRDQCVTNTLNR